MPFTQHLEELRDRLTKALIAVFVASIVCFFFISDIFKVITGPLSESFENASLIGTGPADAFIVKLKLAIAAGVILALPFCFSQAWGFIKPGLHDNERKYATPFVILSTLFFISGVVFCFELILPFAFSFFAEEFLSLGVNPTIKIDQYFSFVLKLLLVFGVVFELPILSFFLARLGLLSHTWLIKKARYIIVCIFLAAAILTPPDAVTQVLLALPLCIIYGICIGVAYIARKKT